jgi:hypothetical protein
LGPHDGGPKAGGQGGGQAEGPVIIGPAGNCQQDPVPKDRSTMSVEAKNATTKDLLIFIGSIHLLERPCPYITTVISNKSTNIPELKLEKELIRSYVTTNRYHGVK